METSTFIFFFACRISWIQMTALCQVRVKRNEVRFRFPNLAAAIKRLVLYVFFFVQTFSCCDFLFSCPVLEIWIISRIEGKSCSRRRAKVWLVDLLLKSLKQCWIRSRIILLAEFFNSLCSQKLDPESLGEKLQDTPKSEKKKMQKQQKTPDSARTPVRKCS